MTTQNNSAVIIKRIGSIAKAAQKVTDAVQETAVQCVIHAVRHGDVTLADRLIDAIGKGMRKNSLRAWFERNGPMYLPKGKTELAYDKQRAASLGEKTDEELTELLMAIKWEEAKPEEKIVSVLDVSEAFDKFIKRLEKQTAEAEVEVRHADLLAKLQQLTREYHAAEAVK